ncbi:MAG: hypothetical protein ACSHYC_14950 [Alphaproteobacteria bacterium]
MASSSLLFVIWSVPQQPLGLRNVFGGVTPLADHWLTDVFHWRKLMKTSGQDAKLHSAVECMLLCNFIIDARQELLTAHSQRSHFRQLKRNADIRGGAENQ